jgi:hypothetical protein
MQVEVATLTCTGNRRGKPGRNATARDGQQYLVRHPNGIEAGPPFVITDRTARCQDGETGPQRDARLIKLTIAGLAGLGIDLNDLEPVPAAA